MALLYFLEKSKSVTSETLHELGLSGSIDRVQSRECFKGPGGSGGCIFSDKSAGPCLKMDTDSQTWSERPGGLWIGFETARPPHPTVLSRDRMIVGEMLQLWDGNRWQIPVIREWRANDASDGPALVYATGLPRTISRTLDNQWNAGPVVPQYRSIWDRTSDAFEFIFGGLDEDGVAKMSDEDAIDFAVDILAVNYRIESHAVSALGLLDFELAGRIVRIAIGAESFEGALKNVASREAPETSTSDSGAERQTQDEPTNTHIDQPAAN